MTVTDSKVQIPLERFENSMNIHEMIEMISDAAVVIQDNQLKVINCKARELLRGVGTTHVDKMVREFSGVAEKRMQRILDGMESGSSMDYKIYRDNSSYFYVELTSHAIEYNGKPALFTTARDITFRKHDLIHASRLQQMNLIRQTPVYRDIFIQNIYMPAKTLSGDFYFFEKVSEQKLFGVLGDVRGKGITSAMKISAFEVMFRETVKSSKDLKTVVSKLDHSVFQYMDDYYIAAILFVIDTEWRTLELVGAGINEFMWVDQANKVICDIIEGPFLGMFWDIEFEYKAYDLDNCSRLILYSDGIEPEIRHGDLDPTGFAKESVFDVTGIVSEYLEAKSYTLKGLEDDCTMLLFDFNYKGAFKEKTLYGLSEYLEVVEEVLDFAEMEERRSELHLVLVELLTNAFKHGNGYDSELPIKVTAVKEQKTLTIEIKDMGIKPKKRHVKTEISDCELLDESGRGLFLINSFADELRIRPHSTVVKFYRSE